jgi:hypothetical protein
MPIKYMNCSNKENHTSYTAINLLQAMIMQC